MNVVEWGKEFGFNSETRWSACRHRFWGDGYTGAVLNHYVIDAQIFRD